MKLLAPIALALMTTAPAQGLAQEFSLSFKWGNIPSCTTGRPNTVPNPAFVLKGLPAGTTSVQFKMTDLDVPTFNHGGSKRLGISQNGTVPSGVFTYKSPCPPNGVHTYEWTATARAGGRVVGTAAARRKYPE